ncbi:MAG: phenylalanine--tRNA ligase subunit beta [Candidatus Zixiibacteriota bacterium]|nr:MAG: phenylalanine--tRNA ligase subunit beta [candidate division Zixibacteria bacterium]
MIVSYKWLKELTGLEWSAQEMGERLTMCGTACEKIEAADRFMDRIVIGKVTDLKAVEGATKIKLASVKLGKTTQDVICGAPNVAVGQTVPVALEGARLDGDIVIKKVKIRGVESSAMICSERELGISDDHSGIMVLDDDLEPGAPFAKQLGFDDFILSFELTPNRADSMSAIGIARDLAALAGVKLNRPPVELSESGEEASSVAAVAIDDPVGCPRYAARIIKNVKIGPSPWWLKRRLLMSGVRPISNIVDITNLVMLETGHPLHAFDLERFGSREVVVRRARNKEKFVTLDGNEHELSPEVLLITNGKTGVAAGGIMGGLDSEIEHDTSNILLEAAYFNPAVIRRGRKELGLVTESSARFEKGADPNGIPFAIDRAAALMQQLAGGEVLRGIIDCYPERIKPRKVILRPERCRYVLGADFSNDTMKDVLTGLEFEVSGDDPLEVLVPTFRPDIEREIDLIEEVARIGGYDKIPDATENIGPLLTAVQYEDRFNQQAKRILTGAGFDEMVHHGLVDGRLTSRLYPDSPQVKIINPVSEDLNAMRISLLQTTMNTIGHNIAHRNLDLCLFEIGKVYLPAGDECVEERRLGLAVTGETVHTWRDQPRPYDFYDIAGVLTELNEHFRWGAVQYIPAPHPLFDETVCFEVVCGGRAVGWAGRINAAVANRFDIKQDIHYAEINLEALMVPGQSMSEFRPLPVYPAAPRDIAIVVDDDVKAGDLVEAVKVTAGELAESVHIFDLYRGKQIESGRKSIAISINYRSREGSLSSEQVDQKQQAVVEVLKRDFKAQIRDN